MYEPVVAVDAEWPGVRLGAVLRRVVEVGQPDLPLLSVSAQRGVTLRGEDWGDGLRAASEDLSGYLVVRPGDIVVNKLAARDGAFGWSAHHGLTSPAYFVLRPVSGIDPRFLDYLLHSSPYLSEIRRRSKSMPPAQFDISWELLRSMELRIPDAESQASIVKFLDGETQRTDFAVDSNQKLDRLLEERRTSVAFDAVVRLPLVPLKRVLESVSGGEWGSEPGSSEVDVWCFRSADFDRSRHLLLSDRAPLRSLTWKQLSVNELHPGDLVLEKSGGGPSTPVGCSVLATEGSLANGPSVCSNFAARLRPRANVLPEYLQIVLAGLHRSGALVPFIKQTTGLQNLDLPAVLQLRVPIAEAGQQVGIVQHVLSVWEEVSAAQDLLRQEEVLIAERRQALITAAVTGQLDVEAVF